MNIEELDGLLVDKIKSGVAGKRLPDGFAERMVSEMRCTKRLRRGRMIAVTLTVIVLGFVLAGLWGETPKNRSRETSLVAVQESACKEKVSGWMILGFFKECFKRIRTNKRKDEY